MDETHEMRLDLGFGWMHTDCMEEVEGPPVSPARFGGGTGRNNAVARSQTQAPSTQKHLAHQLSALNCAGPSP